MPFKTSVSRSRSSACSKPCASIIPVTAPVLGSMRAMVSVCQTFAQISPSIHSSSLSLRSGSPARVTSIVCTVGVGVLRSSRVSRLEPSDSHKILP